MVVSNSALSEVLVFAVTVGGEVIILGGKSKVTEGVRTWDSVVDIDFVMIVASNAENWVIRVSLAVFIGFVVKDLMEARFRLVEKTKLGGVSVALGVGSIEIIDFLVTEGNAVIDGDTAVNILPVD